MNLVNWSSFYLSDTDRKYLPPTTFHYPHLDPSLIEPAPDTRFSLVIMTFVNLFSAAQSNFI